MYKRQLQDNKKGVIIGTQTYGKGIVQGLYSLSDGSGLKITIQKYLDVYKRQHLIIADIKKKQPSLLLVGLGSPKQEKWIYNNLRLTGAKLAIGIGGSFDVMSGNLKRAPKIFCKLGLEWFYRLITQPSRFKRMLKLPKFVIKVRKEMRR